MKGFAAEVVWVIKTGDTDMDPSMAIRSTSEIVMYPHYAQVGHVAHVRQCCVTNLPGTTL